MKKSTKRIALALTTALLVQPVMFAYDSKLNEDIVALELEITKMKTKAGNYADMKEKELKAKIEKAQKELHKKKAKAKKEAEKDSKEVKKSLKKAGNDIKDAGKDIKDAGKDIGNALKDIFN